MKKITIILRLTLIFLVLLLNLGLYWHTPIVTSKKNFLKQCTFSLAPMLEKVMPSVVSINVEGNSFMHPPHISNQHKSYFMSHFRQNKFNILGSGVILDSKNGYIVTNSHVISHANNIQVQLNNGDKYHAIVIGKDSHFDIALLQLKKVNSLHEIKVANSDLLKVGDYVIAIGNPYGLGETVTSGIISALNRSGLNIENYENFIQTDAAINRGNSGGALVNLNGELIGINTAILAPEGGNIGIGFAIPINMVKNLIAQIIKYGQVKPNELGIIGTELNSDLAKIMNINIQRGAFISQVLSQSSADISGIKPGDVIISLNKKPIFSFSALRAEVASLPINTKIELGLLRNGTMQSVIVELKEKIKKDINSADLHLSIKGANFSNFYFNGKNKGVLVTYVEQGTSADRIGLRKNDIIYGINRHVILSINDFRRFLSTKPKLLVLHVQRGNKILYLIT